MPQEFLYLLILLFNFSLIYIANRKGRHCLMTCFVLHLVFATLVADGVINIFGYLVAAGTVFYAPLFTIALLLAKNYCVSDARITVSMGLCVLSVMYFLAWATSQFNDALALPIPTLSAKIIIGSMVGYYVSQKINVYVFEMLKEYLAERFLWLRYNISVILGQTFDSLLFYPIALFGELTLESLFSVMLVGVTVKIIISILATPLIYTASSNRQC